MLVQSTLLFTQLIIVCKVRSQVMRTRNGGEILAISCEAVRLKKSLSS